MSLPDFQYKQVIVHVAGGSGERLRFLADNVVIEDRDKKCILRHSCHRIFAKKIFLRKTKRYQTIKDTCFKRRKSGKQIGKYTDWDWRDSGCADIGSRSVRHDE